MGLFDRFKKNKETAMQIVKNTLFVSDSELEAMIRGETTSVLEHWQSQQIKRFVIKQEVKTKQEAIKLIQLQLQAMNLGNQMSDAKYEAENKQEQHRIKTNERNRDEELAEIKHKRKMFEEQQKLDNLQNPRPAPEPVKEKSKQELYNEELAILNTDFDNQMAKYRERGYTDKDKIVIQFKNDHAQSERELFKKYH